MKNRCIFELKFEKIAKKTLPKPMFCRGAFFDRFWEGLGRLSGGFWRGLGGVWGALGASWGDF